jgi:hypothetical protein
MKTTRRRLRHQSVLCFACGRGYRSRRDLEDHMRSHTGVEYICEISGCDKVYTSRVGFTLHQKYFHSDCPQVKCEQCNKVDKKQCEKGWIYNVQ